MASTPGLWAPFYPLHLYRAYDEHQPDNEGEDVSDDEEDELDSGGEDDFMGPDLAYPYYDEGNSSDSGSEGGEQWRDDDPKAWGEASLQFCEEAYYSEVTGWYDEPIDYTKLPLNVWHKVLSSLDFRGMCSMAMVCPFFYKIFEADFKRLCRRFNIFRCRGETFVDAFSEFFDRATHEVLHDHTRSVYLPNFNIVYVLSLDLNDRNVTCIPIGKDICVDVPSCLTQHNTKLSYIVGDAQSTSIHIHDVGTGDLLKTVNIRGLYYNGHNVVYSEEGSNMLFSVATMQLHRVPIDGKLWISATANDLEHDYYVLHTPTQTFIYDTMTEKCVEMPRYVSSWGKRREAKQLPQKYSTQLLLASNSYVWGDLCSFCIYNLQTGDVLLEYNKRRRRTDWQRHRELFLVVNDFIVVERDTKEIFFYDTDGQTWKSSKTAPARVQQRLYRETFGSVFMAKLIWAYSSAHQPPREYDAIWEFQSVVEEYYERGFLRRVYNCFQRNTLPLRRWLFYYYNKFISGGWGMADSSKDD